MAPLDDHTRQALTEAVRQFGTPSYVYLLEPFREAFDRLQAAFGGRFSVSYAVKANPNRALLEQIADKVATLDVSSGGELLRALDAGYPAGLLTFSGPGKRPDELRLAVEAGCGEMVCESERELATLDRLAGEAGRRMAVFPRINPSDIPRKFGVNMAGRPSQFGIDEEDFERVLAKRAEWKNLDVEGFHIYSGTNCLDEQAIAENFDIFIRLFSRFAAAAGIRPRKLIFGSGFGIPYTAEQRPLDLGRLGELLNPRIDALGDDPFLGDARCVLEMGRFLVGPAGYYLTSVIGEKSSRGTEIRICDGGMNQHLAACGLLGGVVRHAWPMWKVGHSEGMELHEYMLVGPICTTIDTLAQRIELPQLQRGDVVAIGSSGAYGLSSSPTGFISHPPPRELLVRSTEPTIDVVDISGR
jgi:diaminopimelate decarboxylase